MDTASFYHFTEVLKFPPLNLEGHAQSSIHDILAEFRDAALNNREMSDKFERLICRHLELDPQYSERFSNVWLWNEWPLKGQVGDVAHFGWMNLAKVDVKTKFIRKAETTPAHVHDSQVFTELLDETGQAVLADSAYYSKDHEEHFHRLGAKEFLMRKATRNHPLGDGAVEINRAISRMRVRIELVSLGSN